jgi:hypothetical protein
MRQVANNAGIGGLLDEVLSVEEVGVYKPHPKVYQLHSTVGVRVQDISFQSSNPWDAWAASAFDMRSLVQSLLTRSRILTWDIPTLKSPLSPTCHSLKGRNWGILTLCFFNNLSGGSQWESNRLAARKSTSY